MAIPAAKMRIKPWHRACFLDRYTRIKKRKTKKGNKAVVALQRVVIPIKRPETKTSIMLRLWSSITKQRMLKDIEIIQRYMQRVSYKADDSRYKSSSFFAQANILTGGIIRQLEGFSRAIKALHDRTGEA